MSEKYLKSQQYYEDLYDRYTVQELRDTEKRWYIPVPEESDDEEVHKVRMEAMLKNTWADVAFVFKKGERYRNKKRTIEEWIRRDTELDRIYEQSQPISNIQCLECRRMMFVSTKTLDIGYENKPTRVLFMYDCPLGHLPRRAFFSDGEEYKFKAPVCSKCRFAVDEKKERNGNLLTITATCKQCGNKDVSEFDFSPKEEVPDPDFVKDRERFCLDDVEGKRYIDEAITFEANMNMFEESRAKDEKKELYDKARSLKKLTIIELEKLLVPVLEKSDFIKLTLKEPQISRDFVVPFVVYDSKENRNDNTSSRDLKKTIEQTLKGTNWKLMGDGVMYRMGMLEGRLRGYEKEDDLIKLVE